MVLPRDTEHKTPHVVSEIFSHNDRQRLRFGAGLAAWSAVQGYRDRGPLPRPARYVVMSDSSWPVSVGSVIARRFASFSM